MRRGVAWGLIGGVLVAVVAVVAPPARACSCAGSVEDDPYSAYEGRATDVGPWSGPPDHPLHSSVNEVTFEIERTLNGRALDSLVTSVVHGDDGNCGFALVPQAGRRYRFSAFHGADADGTPRLWTHQCSAPRAGGFIEELGEAAADPPQAAMPVPPPASAVPESPAGLRATVRAAPCASRMRPDHRLRPPRTATDPDRIWPCPGGPGHTASAGRVTDPRPRRWFHR